MKRAVVFKLAKGFTQRGKNNYRITANRVDHALMFAYRDRRVKKRVAREGFVAQINAATRQLGIILIFFPCISLSGLERGLKSRFFVNPCLAPCQCQDLMCWTS